LAAPRRPDRFPLQICDDRVYEPYAVVRACGFDLPLVLVPRDTSRDERLEEGRQLSPERRVDRLIDRVKSGQEPVHV
jgi:hypothetical protein